MFMHIIARFLLLPSLVAVIDAIPGGTRTTLEREQVAAPDDQRSLAWLNKRSASSYDSSTKYSAIYDPVWFASIDGQARIAYTRFANALYTFIESGADAHDDDSYQSFAPLLLRAAFHSSGSYFLPDGSGGSNGGTIFHHGELEDKSNGCIAIATKQLQMLFQEHKAVPLSDAVIIAGAVALDVMHFPRMDLVRVRGGRDMITNGVTCRDRLPSSDDDPLAVMSEHYGLTLSELTAFVGGAHNFGAAHGKCSGYHGQWTATPLSWFGVGGTAPTFFPDLLREDWRWYEVCTYYNDTVVYKSIDNPFATASESDHEEEEVHDIPLGCPIMQSVEPLICEEQAMRGCDFEAGHYARGESPCDINLLQIRLKSDFFLKENPRLLPHAQAFAEDADKLALEFGMAYQKVTHLGLDRCGMNGHGCGQGTVCVPSPSAPLGGAKVCARKRTK
jgi:Peroxidase